MSKSMGRDLAKAPRFASHALQGMRGLDLVSHAPEDQGWSGAAAEAYASAIQALRDVRHLLPPDGVAIVDVVLNCPTRR